MLRRVDGVVDRYRTQSEIRRDETILDAYERRH